MTNPSRSARGDIEAYLEALGSKDLLRFITCGSVDDGKSTLIGRLLYESKMICEDQLAALAVDSRRVGTRGDQLDLALLVDGLAAEREQGITIDVAYRYFTSGRRKFIIADTPGHEQYTRNMVTGASTADAAVILLDATKGLLDQSKRHLLIAHLLGIRSVIVAVNKLDLAGYRQGAFEAVRDALDGPQAAEVLSQIPLGRVASTADVANAVLYLVSALGSYANGIAIPLNGGSYLP